MDWNDSLETYLDPYQDDVVPTLTRTVISRISAMWFSSGVPTFSSFVKNSNPTNLSDENANFIRATMNTCHAATSLVFKAERQDILRVYTVPKQPRYFVADFVFMFFCASSGNQDQ